ncbi:unnamed protein product [Ectocarpus sp. 6 AP-2014]
MPTETPIGVRVAQAAARLKSQRQGLAQARQQAQRDTQQRQVAKYKALRRNQTNAPDTQSAASKPHRRDAIAGIVDANVVEAARKAAQKSATSKPHRRDAIAGSVGANVAEAARKAATEAATAASRAEQRSADSTATEDAHRAAEQAAKAEAKGYNEVGAIVQIPRTLVTYDGGSYSVGVSEAHDVAGDGNCFYHAVAYCLRQICASNNNSDLCRILDGWVSAYSRKKKFVAIDSVFVRWMLLVHLDKAWKDDLFARLFKPETEETHPTYEEMKQRLSSPCTTAGWGGMYESVLLNSALGGHVTVALMRREDDGVLTTDYIDESTPAKNFIFLEHHGFVHWKALRVVNFDSFHVQASKLGEYKVNGDFADTDESAPQVAFDTKYLTKTIDVTIDRHSAGGLDSIYRAVFNALNHLKLGLVESNDWASTPLSERLHERFVRFQVVQDIAPTQNAAVQDAGVRFIQYLAANAVGLYDIVFSIENSLDHHVRINLHNTNGMMLRIGDANAKFRHTRDLDKGSTQEIYLLLHETPEVETLDIGTSVWSAIKYEGGEPNDKGSSVLVTDKNQAYVDEAGYTPGLVSGVISGIFHGAQRLTVADAQGLTTPRDVMGFLSNIGDCNTTKDITEAVLREQTSVSQCGIEGPMLVDVGRTNLPNLTSRGLIVWKTLEGRQLDRYDIGSLLARAFLLKSKQQQGTASEPLVTAFFMGNGPVFWKIVINNIRDEKVMEGMHIKLNGLDEFEKKVGNETHARPYYGLNKKLDILVRLLQDIGTASVCRYDEAIQINQEKDKEIAKISAGWIQNETNRIAEE